MEDKLMNLSPEELKRQFDEDTSKVAEQTTLFLETMHPAYMVDYSKKQVLSLSYRESDTILDAFTFFRLASCTIEEKEDLYTYLAEKMAKFFSAVHSLGKPVAYGVVSHRGHTNLVIGFYGDDDKEADATKKSIRSVMEGLLDGIELLPYKPRFSERKNTRKNVGFVSAVPSVKIGDERQKFDLSPLMKGLNGQDYTVLAIARPLPPETVSDKYGEIVKIRDACFAVSKRNISRQQGTAHTVGETKGNSTTDARFGAGSFGLGMFGVSIGLSLGKSHAETKSFTESISDAINRNEGISADVQNGFALELMEYADKAVERLRQGRSNGMWETLISYSADSVTAAGIIRACVAGEMAKPNPDILPLVSQGYQLDRDEAEGNSLILPKIIRNGEKESSLCTALTSEELGMICPIPVESVPDFELKKGKVYPIISDRIDGVKIGLLTEGHRMLEHMPFALSHEDLARHTFVSGITGSGKTTTVKRILRDAGTPFLVIESAKKEYRNIKLADGSRLDVYTLGKPEINCLRFNPFYIQCGVSPQMHIDFLKDLFNASFSFYGPMPYILEKCLHTIYQKKGWNLTLGYHPYLMDINNAAGFFAAGYMKCKYARKAHKFLFPTMQELKDEIKRYIEKEMHYEGEVAGNIKTAILARLESLCSGTKGYMFNTNDYADMGALLKRNVVFELEGLADDADKAFCVGLFVILVNEYRQVEKETAASDKTFSHLLVIEEAHRLLKNVDTERTSADMGNPKGKAVEHFTNMIAEMRSYGQGVIIAEQIPTKLAPDVIKNTSNKIVQRLVAADDQELMANTVGLSREDAIYMGSLTNGMALCHKEGMSLPVNVKIDPTENKNVTDEMLFIQYESGRMDRINTGIVKECAADILNEQGLKILNSLLIQDFEYVKQSVLEFRKAVRSSLVRHCRELIMCNDEEKIYAEILAEAVTDYLSSGVYRTKELVDDKLCEKLVDLFRVPDRKALEGLRDMLRWLYGDDPKYKGKYVISQMVINQSDHNTDIKGTIDNYFLCADEASTNDICGLIRGIYRKEG